MARSAFRPLLSRLHRIEGRVRFVLSHVLGLEGLDSPRNAAVFRTTLGVARIAVLFRVICWGFTLRYFDEGLVASLHSTNFLAGHGLTSAVGEAVPILGSESPLRVLIPFLGNLVHRGAGLELLKLTSIPATFLTLYYLVALGVHPAMRMSRALVIAATGYAAFEFHQIVNAMGGLETQLATMLLVMSVYYTVAWRPWSLGLSLGFGLLARPDTFLWAGAVLLIGLIHSPRTVPRVLAGIAVPCLPWVVFTTWYYGSPAPDAWLALFRTRAHWWCALPEGGAGTWLAQLGTVASNEVYALLGPTYGGSELGRFAFYSPGNTNWIAHAMFGCTLLGGLSLLRRENRAMLPLVLSVLLYGAYFLLLAPGQEDWRKTGFALLLMLLALRGVHVMTGLIPKSRLRKAARTTFCLVYVGCLVSVLPVAYHVERQYQQGIVNPTQRAAGRYLAEHLGTNAAVACTAPGYLGYHSGGRILDWPGRTSGTVREWMQDRSGEDPRDFGSMVQELLPEYVFLSASELLPLKRQEWFREAYALEEVFRADPEASREVRRLVPMVDTVFRLYKRQSPVVATAQPAP